MLQILTLMQSSGVISRGLDTWCLASTTCSWLYAVVRYPSTLKLTYLCTSSIFSLCSKSSAFLWTRFCRVPMVRVRPVVSAFRQRASSPPSFSAVCALLFPLRTRSH